MSRLAAAALRRGVAASRDPSSSSRLAASAPGSARLFSADASGEAAAAGADSQNDPFLKASSEGGLVLLVVLPSIYLFVFVL
jgi:hypothetical protein